MADKDWIVIADAANARVFERDSGTRDVHLAFELEHGESRRKTSELASDQPGRKSSHKADKRSSLPPSSAPQDVEHQRFAKELAGRLKDGLSHGSFEKLHLVAAPRFLGRLREELDDDVSAHLGEEKPLDLVPLDEPELLERVQQVGALRR